MVPLWPGSHNAILVNLSINIVYDCNDLTKSGQIWWFDQKLHDKHVSGFPDLVTGSPECVQVLYSAQWDSVSVLYVYNNTKVGN